MEIVTPKNLVAGAEPNEHSKEQTTNHLAANALGNYIATDDRVAGSNPARTTNRRSGSSVVEQECFPNPLVAAPGSSHNQTAIP